ncbi:MAG: heavy metal-binding domain-containing protein [Leptospira bouyouniensis]
MKTKSLLLISLLFALIIVSCRETSHNHKDVYTCPMHPQIEMDHPGECPICGMQLVKKEEAIEESNHANHISSEDENKTKVESGLKLSENKQTILNLDTIVVTKGEIIKAITLSGQVAYDPEIFATVNEYKSVPNDGEWGRDLRQGIRLKFAKLGLSESQFRYALSKNVDLFLTGKSGKSTLVVLQVYENDSSYLKVGKKIELDNASDPSVPLVANIVAVGNLINQETRTLSVWCEVRDPMNVFKPQMYVQGYYEIQKLNVLRVPKESILPTGKSDLVYHKTGPNQFLPKKIKTGFSSSDWVEVTEGLSENDEIVSKASFLLDSESKLKLGGDKNDQHNH